MYSLLFNFLFTFWHDLNPVSIRVSDKIDAHSRIFVTDAAHFLMLFMDAVVIIYMKSQMELTFSKIVWLCAVF